MKRDFFAGVATAKVDLRREMRARLAGLSPALRAEASLVVCQMATHLPAFASGHRIALFAPLASEPDIQPLLEEAWAQEKRVVLPLMIDQETAPRLEWRDVAGWDDLVLRGPFGLREPDPLRCPAVSPTEIDCVFVPGVAFDDDGYRLGRGGGFYDSFLSQVPRHLPCTGLMFSCQRVSRVPREPHDQPLREVLTEDGLIAFA